MSGRCVHYARIGEDCDRCPGGRAEAEKVGPLNGALTYALLAMTATALVAGLLFLLHGIYCPALAWAKTAAENIFLWGTGGSMLSVVVLELVAWVIEKIKLPGAARL